MATPPTVRVELDPADKARLLHDVKEFDGELSKSLTRFIRLVAKPVGERTLLRGAGGLPQRGGLADRVAEGRVSVSVRTGLRSAGVSVRLLNREGDDLAGIDKGEIRHPVFGRWLPDQPSQRIRANLFSDEFQREERVLRTAVDAAILDAARTIRSGEARP